MATMPAPQALDPKTAARALGASGGVGATKLMALLCDPSVDLDEVFSALKREPALAARVLKVSNSPYYRQSGHVGTLERAVALLGLTAIRGIAAAACLDRAAPPRAGSAFDPERFRRHSLAVGCAAQQLSRACGAGVDGEAFIAGLLHDIGILAMAKADAPRMARFEPLPVADVPSGLSAERDHFGMDHLACSGALVESWSLPAWLLAPLTCHVDPDPPASAQGLDTLPALVALADHLADRAGLDRKSVV